MHNSPYSGSWYPDDVSELNALLNRLFQESASRTGSWLAPAGRAFVVPHAGLIYSGAVAAAVFRHIAALRPRRVVLLGFSHRGGQTGILIPKVDGIRTPCGDVATEVLSGLPEFKIVDEALVCDHSIEIQLPLLKRAAPDAILLPVYVNGASPELRRTAARRLASLAGPDTVFIASSDLTHFGRNFGFQPFPVDSATSARLADLDGQVMDAAGSLDSGLFLDAITETSSTACGIEPIALLLEILQASEGPEIFQERLDYRTSGDLTGDFHHSVSYGALGYFPYTSFEVDEPAGELLLESARRTLSSYQETGRRTPIFSESSHPALDARLGAFVTIYSQGELRGCVGTLSNTDPLRRLIPELTLSSACNDSRFSAITAADTDLRIEISILTPMKRVRGRGDFRVNEHGALLKSGHRHGLLLPQVATEYGWGAEEFFDGLARKSRLSPDVYDDPATQLYVFRAQHLRYTDR